MLPLFISLCTKHLYGSQLSGDTQLALPNMVLMHTSMPIQILFFGSLLSAIMSTTSSAILAPASIFSENLVKPLMKDRLTDAQLLMVTRISILLFSVVATVMATLRENIYELVSESSILSLVSLFAPLTLGLYWNRANSIGAMLSMVTGLATWLFFKLIYPIEIPSLVPATLVSIGSLILGSIIWSRKCITWCGLFSILSWWDPFYQHKQEYPLLILQTIKMMILLKPLYCICTSWSTSAMNDYFLVASYSINTVRYFIKGILSPIILQISIS